MSVHYPRDVAHDNSVEFKSVFSIYSVSPTLLPREDLWQFFQNGWEFFNEILHACYAFYLCYTTNFYSVICNFDEVVQYLA